MIEDSEVIIRLAGAALCGAIIGIERERKEWAAGMRTHMMVAVGSALYMIVSAYAFEDLIGHDKIDLDPSRIAAQVVSGIGFLGAGTIMFLRQGIVRGLTTASGLWTVAAIGLAMGTGMFWAAFATTLIAITILWLLQPLEGLLFTKKLTQTLLIGVHSEQDAADIFHTLIRRDELSLARFSLDKKENGSAEIVIMSDKTDVLKIVSSELSEDPRIKSVRFN